MFATLLWCVRRWRGAARTHPLPGAEPPVGLPPPPKEPEPVDAPPPRAAPAGKRRASPPER